jgi:hypothetical protein
MEKSNPIRVSSISELHRLLQLPKPLHPMISLVDNAKMSRDFDFMYHPFFLISTKFLTNILPMVEWAMDKGFMILAKED